MVVVVLAEAAGAAAASGELTASDAASDAAPSSAPRRDGVGGAAAGNSQRVTRRAAGRVGLTAPHCTHVCIPQARRSNQTATATRRALGERLASDEPVLFGP